MLLFGEQSEQNFKEKLSGALLTVFFFFIDGLGNFGRGLKLISVSLLCSLFALSSGVATFVSVSFTCLLDPLIDLFDELFRIFIGLGNVSVISLSSLMRSVVADRS